MEIYLSDPLVSKKLDLLALLKVNENILQLLSQLAKTISGHCS